MFLKSSRYYGIGTVAAQDASGREVKAVKFRRLPEMPEIPGEAAVIQGADRLDLIADARYQDAARYWHVADANSELEAERLAGPPGRIIAVPEK